MSMRTFGKRSGGGRRTVHREHVVASALLSTIQNCRAAVLTDLSITGARLRGDYLPIEGQAVTVKIDTIRAFGLVAWSKRDECGIVFEEPLARFDVERLKREVNRLAKSQSGLEVRLAFEDWATGFAR